MSYYLDIGGTYNQDHIIEIDDDRAKVRKLTKLLDKIQTYGIDIDCKNVVDNEDIAWFLLKKGVVL